MFELPKLDVPHLQSAKCQRELIPTIKTPDKYWKLEAAYFELLSEPERANPEYILDPFFQDLSPAYAQLLALKALVFAQYGFPSLIGGYDRYEGKGWRQRSPLHPYHILALICYGAEANVQLGPIREKLSKKLAHYSPPAREGAKGLSLYIQNGKVKKPDLRSKEEVRKFTIWAERRYESPWPICEIDLELNSRLAKLGFTGHLAETLTENEFNQMFYPEIAPAFEGLLDPKGAILDLAGKDFPKRMYRHYSTFT